MSRAGSSQQPTAHYHGGGATGGGSIGLVAECALTALHTEMVLYVVRHRAQQQQAIAEVRAREEALHASSNDDGGGILDAAISAHLSDPGGCASSDGGADGGSRDASFNESLAALAVAPEMTRGACVEYVLDAMGLHAGVRITERLLHREPLVRYTPLEITRFVGGNLWRALFGKKVDKMKHLDNIYFSLVETNFAWHRCPQITAAQKSSAAASGGAGGSGSAGSGGGGSGSALATGTIVAPGFAADGTLIDAEAALLEAKAIAEHGSRSLPSPRDMLQYMQGVLCGVVDTLLGPGSQAIVTAQVVGGGVDAQFILDFRQCARL